MKKLLFISAASVIGLFSSCSKENDNLTPQKPTFSYDKKNMDQIIKLADPSLYQKIHSQKNKIILQFTNGTWITDPVSGKRKCVSSNDICSIKIISELAVATGNDSTFVMGDHTYTYEDFTSSGDAILIAVEPTTPVAYYIKSLTTDTNNSTQEVELTYETF